jgi:hypothetical protein
MLKRGSLKRHVREITQDLTPRTYTSLYHANYINTHSSRCRFLDKCFACITRLKAVEAFCAPNTEHLEFQVPEAKALQHLGMRITSRTHASSTIRIMILHGSDDGGGLPVSGYIISKERVGGGSASLTYHISTLSFNFVRSVIHF